MLKIMDFAKVVSDKKIKKDGFSKGDEVLVISFKPSVVDKNDPYTFKNYVLVARVVDNLPQLPHKDNDYSTYLADARSFEPVSKERSSELTEHLSKKYHRR